MKSPYVQRDLQNGDFCSLRMQRRKEKLSRGFTAYNRNSFLYYVGRAEL
jgi:hypothetical protein